MLHKDTEVFDNDLLTHIFLEVDEFCTALDTWYTHVYLLSHPRLEEEIPNQDRRKPRMRCSEIVTIMIAYHLSGYKNFQYFYERLVVPTMRPDFPTLVSYQHFIELERRAIVHLYMYAQYLAYSAEQTGVYIIDSKKLPVCDIKRAAQHKVFDGIATKGKSSTGWFFGLKLHLIINHIGDIVRFKITPANVADNNKELLVELLQGLHGKLIGDKGYLTKFFEDFLNNGIQIITKIRKNMKNKLMPIEDKLLLRKRPVIEAINDILMTVCDIDYTRHRNPLNALCKILSGLIAYHYLPNKPAILLKKLIST